MATSIITKYISTMPSVTTNKALTFVSTFSNPSGYCVKIDNYLFFHYAFPCNTNTSSTVFTLPSGLKADGAVTFIANPQTAGQVGAYVSIADNATTASGLSAMPFYANTWYDISGIIKVK